jgi:hypothetical protein
MTSKAIPDDIRRFILTSIPSVPYLEALLLLRGKPEHDWDARGIARALYVHDNAGAALLEALQAGGLAIRSESGTGCRYRPASPELGKLVDGLAAVYVVNLVDVTNLVHARSSRRAQRLADVFVWRKEP